MNPLHQNYAHVKAIEAAIAAFKNMPIIPIVAFSAKSTLIVKTTSHVTYFHKVNRIIRCYTDRAINDDELSSIVSLLHGVDINTSAMLSAASQCFWLKVHRLQRLILQK